MTLHVRAKVRKTREGHLSLFNLHTLRTSVVNRRTPYVCSLGTGPALGDSEITLTRQAQGPL